MLNLVLFPQGHLGGYKISFIKQNVANEYGVCKEESIFLYIRSTPSLVINCLSSFGLRCL